MKEQIKNFVNNRRNLVIVLIVLLIVILLLSAILILKHNSEKELTPDIELNSSHGVISEVTIEIGDELPTLESFLEDNSDISIDAILKIPEDAIRVGEYTVRILDGDNEFISKLILVDTTAPQLVVKDAEVTTDDTIDIELFIESCTDNSGEDCNYSYAEIDENSNVVYKETITASLGKNTVQLIAYDNYGNKTEVYEAKLTLKQGVNKATEVTSETVSTNSGNSNPGSTNNANNSSNNNNNTTSGSKNNNATGNTSSGNNNTGTTSGNSGSNTSGNNGGNTGTENNNSGNGNAGNNNTGNNNTGGSNTGNTGSSGNNGDNNPGGNTGNTGGTISGATCKVREKFKDIPIYQKLDCLDDAAAEAALNAVIAKQPEILFSSGVSAEIKKCDNFHGEAGSCLDRIEPYIVWAEDGSAYGIAIDFYMYLNQTGNNYLARGYVLSNHTVKYITDVPYR